MPTIAEVNQALAANLSARRGRRITDVVFKSEKKRLRKELRKAEKEEQERRIAQILAQQKAERERIAEKRRVALVKAREALAAKKAKTAVSWKLQYEWKWITEKGNWKDGMREFNRVYTGPYRPQIDAEAEAEVERLRQDSKKDVRNVRIVIVKTEAVKAVKADKNAIKMKAVVALTLDGDEVQTWNTGKGQCVYDFLDWRYGDAPGCKKVIKNLDNLFRTYTVNDEEVISENPRAEGVCVYQLKKFCEAVGINMYALDEDNRRLVHFQPVRNLNKQIPPLAFRVMNEHLYPIIDNLASIAGKYRGGGSKRKGEKKEESIEEILPVDVRHMDLDVKTDTRAALLVNTMVEAGKQVYPFKNLKMADDCITSFVLDGKLYVFDSDGIYTTAKTIKELNGEKYNGETVHSILIDAMKKYDAKSECNPSVLSTLTAPNVKFRTHYGIIGEYDAESIHQMVENGEAITADINKCYTYEMMNPRDDWISIQFNDDWEKFDGNLRTGLYYVFTEDLSLLHGTNVYSNKILERALEEGIEFKVLMQLIPTQTIGRNYFNGLLQDIDVMCKGDKSLKKALINNITGMLGKHQTYVYMPKITTDPQIVWNDMLTAEYATNETFCIHEGDFYIYGIKKPIIKSDMNVPMYIQILDGANIQLYDMIKKSGGQAVFRKTDCAVIRGGKLTWGDEIGQYKQIEVPTLCGRMRSVEERSVSIKMFGKWIEHPEIRSSSQVDDVWGLLKETRGLCMLGRAGTGKSYTVCGVEKKFLEENPDGLVFKVAFTNKAALKIGGQTIHKCLKIDAEGGYDFKWLYGLKDRPMLFMCDEISMNGKALWKAMVEFKRRVNALFLFCGDYRQVRPVEDGNVEYFGSAALKWLCNFHRVELVERQRYDEALWKFAEDVFEKGETDYNAVQVVTNVPDSELSKAVNISWTNATADDINKRANEYGRVGDISVETEKGKVWLYTGLPIIATKTCAKIDIAKNEMFVVRSVGEELVAVSTRVEGEHVVAIATEDFGTFFALNFCSTTHKQQGETISGPIRIWDYDRMDKHLRYTAVTRAKSLSQISIVM